MTRKDITIIHQAKFTLNLSIFEPEEKNNAIILYLHGNSSSKLESKNLLEYLPTGFSLASFDFIGCGLNKSKDIITLGHSEQDQAETIVNYLKQKNYFVILWGRSMGASTALLHGKCPIIVADSSFRSLKTLCKQIAKKGAPTWVPNCLIECLFPCFFYKLRKDVEEKADYDMNDVDVKFSLSKIDLSTTLIFLTGD